MLTALVVFLAGALFLWQGWRSQQKVKASMAWPYVPGRVSSASVRRVVDHGDAQTAESTSYFPLVNYEYQVGAQIYQGNRMAFHERGYSSNKKAFAVVEGFPAGHPIWVFYDPANPQNAVIERAAKGNKFQFVLGAFLVIVAIALLIKG